MVYPYKGILFSNKNKWSTVITWMSFENESQMKEASYKRYIQNINLYEMSRIGISIRKKVD